MRLFLASAELSPGSVLGGESRHGGESTLGRELARLAGPVARIAIVLNPRDDDPGLVRPEAFARERESLGAVWTVGAVWTGAGRTGDVGTTAVPTSAAPASAVRTPEVFELDLRLFDGRSAALSEALAGAGLIWITGGNMLALGALMASTGLDQVLAARLAEDSIVYAGYSAGACVAGPRLTGAELTGRARDGDEPWWGGLGLIDFSIVPHLPGPSEPENEYVRIARQLEVRGLPYRALRNGEAIVVAAGTSRVISDLPLG